MAGLPISGVCEFVRHFQFQAIRGDLSYPREWLLLTGASMRLVERAPRPVGRRDAIYPFRRARKRVDQVPWES